MQKLLLLSTSILFTSCSTSVGVGAGVGGGSGSSVGVGVSSSQYPNSYVDQQDRAALQVQSPSTLRKIDRGESLSTSDIKQMTKAGFSNSSIIEQIDATRSTFHLSDREIASLQKAGVSQKVINYMIETGNP